MITPSTCTFCLVDWPGESESPCPRCGRTLSPARPGRGRLRLVAWGIGLVVLVSLGYSLMRAVDNVKESAERIQ